MYVLATRNVHQALPMGLELLVSIGYSQDSRNGPVIVAPGPVTTLYREPTERVLFWAERDANPFFHFFESLWMLAGRNDIISLTPYVRRMSQYSDDGFTLHGAYGHRWMHHFTMIGEDGGEAGEINQVSTIINMLRRNKDERRCVLTMWDPSVDLARDGKDLPCNTHAYFTRDHAGSLNMTVCCRSNDMIWGAYGANAVHFSMLQEFMAAGIGCRVGSYWQISNNYHAYKSVYDPLQSLADQAKDPYRTQSRNPYVTGQVDPYPLVNTPIAEWLQDLCMMLDEGVVIGLRDPFFRRVAVPIMHAHRAFKKRDIPIALEIMEQCRATDWRLACTEWLERRRDR